MAEAAYLPPIPAQNRRRALGDTLMKKILFATAMTVATLAGAPAFAAKGYVGAAATHTEVDVAGFEGDGATYDLFGGVAVPTSESWGLQFDGGVTFSDFDDSDNDTSVSGNAHLYHESEGGKIGGFVGASSGGDITVWNGGVEGQAFLDNMNLSGSVGYFSVDDFDVDGWGALGSASVFVTDNFTMFGGLGFATADAGGVDVDGWTGSVGAEYQLANTPVSFFGAYSHGDVGDFDVTSDSFTLGVTYSFSGTLKERERSGPGLPGLSGIAGLFLF